LEDTQWWPPEKLRREQFRFAAKLIAHARATTSYYGDLLWGRKALDADKLADGFWSEIPVLARATVNAEADRLLSRRIPEAHGPKDTIYTSGTTGRPIRVVRTRLALWYWSALTLRDHHWHRRDLAGTLAVIRTSTKGVAVYPKGARFGAWGSSDRVFKTGPCVSLNINSRIDEMAEWLGREDPDYLLTHPTVVARLARHCLAEGIRFPRLKELQTLSEILGGEVRALAREAWDVPVSDMYSGREVGYMALQCPDHEHYHVQGEAVLLEVVDDAGRPCRPGETGRVLVTTLHNYAMPLIRYEIGDYATLGESCPCGRGLPVLTRIMGRKQNILHLPGGGEKWTLLSSGDIRDLMNLAPIRQYQFAQVETDLLEVRLATARDLSEDEEAAVGNWTTIKFGADFRICFVYADELKRTKAGKFQDFVCELPEEA